MHQDYFVGCINCVGSSLKARALAEYYGVALVSVDDIIMEALFYSGTPAAVSARQLCTAPKDEVEADHAAPTVVATANRKSDKAAHSKYSIMQYVCSTEMCLTLISIV